MFGDVRYPPADPARRFMLTASVRGVLRRAVNSWTVSADTAKASINLSHRTVPVAQDRTGEAAVKLSLRTKKGRSRCVSVYVTVGRAALH